MNHRILMHYYVRTWKCISFHDNANNRALTTVSRYVLAMWLPWLCKRQIQNSEWTAFCILEFSKSESLICVQRAFRRAYKCKPPIQENILRWYQQSHNDGLVDVPGMTRHCFHGRPGGLTFHRVTSSFEGMLKTVCTYYRYLPL